MDPLSEAAEMSVTTTLSIDIAYILLGIIVLIVAKLIKDALTPFKIDEELTARDNPALGLAMAGYFAGVMIIFIAAVMGDPFEPGITTATLLKTMGGDFLYALGGILALNLGRWVVDKLILTEFSTVKEIIEDRNAGTGAVECGAYIATGLIVAGAVHGEGGNPLTAVAFFVLGQIALVLFTRFYELITPYKIHEEIERDNVAAGVALGSSMVAIAIVLFKGTAGDFDSWAVSLRNFGITATIGFVLLMALRKVSDALFLPGTTIQHEIANDRNLNAAWMEGVIAVGIASMVFVLL